jgi:chorismate dehydratase
VVTTLAAPSSTRNPDTASRAAVRLGAVSYLNVEPIIHGLDRDPAFSLLREVPSRVAERLHAGEIDLGTIPSIEYAFGDYAIVPGIAIGSRGPVRSVNLYHERPLTELRRVALDTSSRTSVALLKVLLRERLGRDPEYLEMGPSLDAMLGAADGALIIGDPALYLEGSVEHLDLGEAWQRTTGLPFVYAFWAGPRGVIDAAGIAALQGALASGRKAVREIAQAYAGHGARHARTNETYLTEHIHFDLGAAEEAGLREFYRRAFALGLIPRIPELRFHGHS